MKYKVIAIDDDKVILKLIQVTLSKEGYNILTANRGETGLEMVRIEDPDLVILDLKLPDIDGLEICKILKKNKKTKSIPVIILSARSKTENKIEGLKLGADDYIAKPFSYRELVARVEAVLRRALWKGEPEEIIKKGNININLTKHTVQIKNKFVELTNKEFDILFLFMRKPGRVLNETFIVDSVWGWEYSDSVAPKTLDVHIYKLRKKLGPKVGKKIQTVRGIGYKFVDKEE